MKLFVPNQTTDGETRVALVPKSIAKLSKLGAEVVVEKGAGTGAFHSDEEFEQAGAATGDESNWSDADVIVTMRPPSLDQIERMKEGAVLTGMLAPLKHPKAIKMLADGKATSFAMEFIPRISRAQAMDVLSSQASIAGYVAAILAAESSAKMFPMMMTAAGTIAPSRVMVIGAGVAGLQAIATAKRLGAVVEAYDVRPAVKEQVESLGGRFIDLPMTKHDSETEGGYAREQTEDERQQQQELMAKHVAASDAVITTAAVFGKAPPMLIPKEVVDRMHEGSVIVDLAADVDAGRGNCELTQPGKRISVNGADGGIDGGVTIVGETNLPALASVHASQMYANNMLAFLKEFLAEGKVQLTLDDEIQSAAMITHGGEVVNAMAADAIK